MHDWQVSNARGHEHRHRCQGVRFGGHPIAQSHAWRAEGVEVWQVVAWGSDSSCEDCLHGWHRYVVRRLSQPSIALAVLVNRAGKNLGGVSVFAMCVRDARIGSTGFPHGCTLPELSCVETAPRSMFAPSVLSDASIACMFYRPAVVLSARLLLSAT